MRFWRIIWKDILSLNSKLAPAVKIAGLIFVIALIVGAFYLGAEWWSVPILHKGQYHPRGRVAGVILIIIFIVYFTHVIDRYRKSR